MLFPSRYRCDLATTVNGDAGVIAGVGKTVAIPPTLNKASEGVRGFGAIEIDATIHSIDRRRRETGGARLPQMR